MIQHYIDEAEIIYNISKKLDLSYADSVMLAHDVENLRGKEWLPQIKSLHDKELLKQFTVIAHL